MTRPPSHTAAPPGALAAERAAAATPSKPALLASVLVSARREVARAAHAGPVDRETWREITGERIASRTEVGQLEQGTLQVLVDSPVWAQELAFLARELVERLRSQGLPVDRIRFRVATVAPLDARPRRERRVAPAPLPDPLATDLARIEDPELRATITEAARFSLGLEAIATGSRAARAPRSAVPGSGPPGPSAPVSRGGPRRRA